MKKQKFLILINRVIALYRKAATNGGKEVRIWCASAVNYSTQFGSELKNLWLELTKKVNQFLKNEKT